MNALARIVLGQPVSEVGRVATIALRRISEALENVGKAHGSLFNPGAHSWKAPNGPPSAAPNRGAHQPSFAKATEGTLLHSSRLARFRAKDGEGGGS